MEARHPAHVHLAHVGWIWYAEVLLDRWLLAEEEEQHGDVVIDEPVDRQIGRHRAGDGENNRR